MKVDRGHARGVRLVATLAVMGLGSVLLGCPGTLSNPDEFTEQPECTGATVEEIFENSCGGGNCHDADQPAQNLDLVSPNVADRLFGVSATGAGCEDRLLAVAGDPDLSYLVDKVDGSPGICGARMPFSAALDPREVACIEDWIAAEGSLQ